LHRASAQPLGKVLPLAEKTGKLPLREWHNFPAVHVASASQDSPALGEEPISGPMSVQVIEE